MTVALEPLDLDTLTVALMRAQRLSQDVIDDEVTRLGAALSAQKLLKHLPPLYQVKIT